MAILPFNPLKAVGAVANGVVHAAETGADAVHGWFEEIERRRNRPYTPIASDNKISQSEFETIVNSVAQKIPRVADVNIDNAFVRVTIDSNTGLTSWTFTADFNDYGYFTGEYWLYSENNDSPIPSTFADRVSLRIRSEVAASVTTP